MESIKKIKVRLSGLTDGIHHFEFPIGESFFETIEFPSLESGNVLLKVLMDKKPSVIELSLQFEGKLQLICDRSLDPFEYPLNKTEKLFLRKGESFQELSEDVWVINDQQDSVDLTGLVRDLLVLTIPVKCLHPRYDGEDTGDEVVFSTEPAKEETQEASAESNEVDPRWEALKKLKSDN